MERKLILDKGKLGTGFIDDLRWQRLMLHLFLSSGWFSSQSVSFVFVLFGNGTLPAARRGPWKKEGFFGSETN